MIEWRELPLAKLKLKVRFDFSGKSRSKGLLWGSKNGEELAEEIRQHKVSLVRNVPIQGIHIEEVDMSQEVYTIIDEITGRAVWYAPVYIVFIADSIEDAIKFTMKEEFRTVEVIEPQELSVPKIDIERLLFRISEELINYKNYLERKIDNWK